jgi:DNA-binding protein H-NS
MIEVLEKRLERLQKIVDQADTTEKTLSDEIRALIQRKRRLENLIKAGQVPPIAQLPEPTAQPQVQPAQARRPARKRR